jgi:hypothetical protein
MTEDERGHFRVPETGLVAEVNTGFQHFAHSDRHCILQGWVLNDGQYTRFRAPFSAAFAVYIHKLLDTDTSNPRF